MYKLNAVASSIGRRRRVRTCSTVGSAVIGTVDALQRGYGDTLNSAVALHGRRALHTRRYLDHTSTNTLLSHNRRHALQMSPLIQAYQFSEPDVIEVTPT